MRENISWKFSTENPACIEKMFVKSSMTDQHMMEGVKFYGGED